MSAHFDSKPTPSRFARAGHGAVAMRLPVLNACVAAWLLAFLNVPFWRALWNAVGGWDFSSVGFALSLPVFVFLWVWLLLECLTWGRAARPVLAAVLLLSAGAAYFMNAYGMVFDRTMIENIVTTHAAEALELVSASLVGWLVLFAALPLWLLSRVRVVRPA